jgi:Fur family ferric uptake transcriptional regulator
MSKCCKYNNQSFTTLINKRELIINQLREKGCRITTQRKLIIDIILGNDCSCCKEIYYEANLKDPSIGIATVYRMITSLEEIGAINRKNQYQISCENIKDLPEGQIIFMDENKVTQLSGEGWYEAMKASLKAKGYIMDEDISVIIKKKTN